MSPEIKYRVASEATLQLRRKGSVMVIEHTQLICWCCRVPFIERNSETDPFPAELRDYCEFCAEAGCDYNPDVCPNQLIRR